MKRLIPVLLFAFALSSCGNDADSVGIGALCTSSADCSEEMTCLQQFRGGACGKSGCSNHADCPEPGLCVLVDGEAICLRSCQTKSECNANRSAEHEANCSSSLDLIEESSSKACIPPSGP
jgi:hypothetical protein